MIKESVLPLIVIRKEQAEDSQAQEIDSALPLEFTSVRAQVFGPVASVVVSQRFGNPLKEAAELDYLFPLPENAAVTGFELQIGKRRVVGDIQELEAARATYQQARGEGRRTGLLEQRRENLFAVQLANIQPGETISAVMRYQQRMKFEDDSYTFVFPMGITPKYDSPEHPGEGRGVHAPIAHGSEQIGSVEIELSVDAGVEIAGEPFSPSHPIETVRLDERRLQVRTAGEQIPDHDFVLRYTVAGEQVKAAGWTSAGADQEIFLAAFIPPRMDEEIQPLPREFIFVLDRSGSMTGEPIAQARNALRACLRTLNPEDTFRILLFDNELDWYRAEAARVTQEELYQADEYLAKVQGRGGTEIVRALEAALAVPGAKDRTRFVVFLTDGAVSAEERALEQVRKKIGNARLFSFGIGPSVNRALLSRMASLGRGSAAFLQLDEDIEGEIIRFQDRVSFPVITDLQLTWENAKVYDVYPSRLPDLYIGQPLEISGRMVHSGSGPARFVLRGKRGEETVILQVNLPENTTSDPAINRIWARARIDDLFERQSLEPRQADDFRAEIVGLALKHHLATPYTAFVAVDTEVAGEGNPRIIHVAQPLPAGLHPEAFMGSPQAFLAASMPLPSAPDANTLIRSMSAPYKGRTKGFEIQRIEKSMMSADPETTRPVSRKIVMKSDQLQETAPDALPSFADRQGILRWLARTQNLNGSWNDDLEWTAAALLAFIRAGNTNRAGSFRQIVRRAMNWLADQRPDDWRAFLRARVFQEMAQATGEKKDRQQAQAAVAALPQPSLPLERAALNPPQTSTGTIRHLEDLRIAVLSGSPAEVPEALLQGPQADLARVWAASIKR